MEGEGGSDGLLPSRVQPLAPGRVHLAHCAAIIETKYQGAVLPAFRPYGSAGRWPAITEHCIAKITGCRPAAGTTLNPAYNRSRRAASIQPHCAAIIETKYQGAVLPAS